MTPLAVEAEPLVSAASAEAGKRNRLLVGWHLCSLDAPTVAVVWTVFVARAYRVNLPAALPVAMALAVWALYAADRLLDARGLSATRTMADDLEARHYFHRRHRLGFLIGIVTCAFALAGLLPWLQGPVLRWFCIEAALLAGWFFWIHHAKRLESQLPGKELVVGAFFSMAIFAPVLVERHGWCPALLFAGLLAANGLFISAWERVEGGMESAVRLTAAWLLISVVCAGWIGWAIPAACGVSCAALLLLHRRRGVMERTTLRAAADAALLSPLLLLPLLPR